MASTPESLRRVAEGGTVSEQLAAYFADLTLDGVSDRAVEVAIDDLIDAAGLCVAARRADYIQPLIAGWDEDGDCTAIGHKRALSPAGAALVNGTAIHGEDFDDTLEGAGIRLGAMVIPAVLAVCESQGRSGRDALLGIISGLELVARLSHAAPGGPQRAGFHHVGVMGVFGAALGVGVALDLNSHQITAALGLAASFSSGLVTQSGWTKRIHPGIAASNGYRAAVLAANGFGGPASVFDGPNNFFTAFTPHTSPRVELLTADLGQTWMMERIAFKPFACGTTIQPYVDCMLRLASRGIESSQITRIVCPTSEDIVTRQWEPLAEKRAPTSGYAGKFSAPYAMAVAFFDRDAGLRQFTDERVADAAVLELASKVTYEVDPSDPYPAEYTGRLRATLIDGSVLNEEQPYFRGGSRAPLGRDDLLAKLRDNAVYGGWSVDAVESLAAFCCGIADSPDMGDLAEFRR